MKPSEAMIIAVMNAIFAIFGIHSLREHWNPQMTSSQRQWLHSSVG